MKIVIDIQDDVYKALKEDIYPIPDTERLALVFKTLVEKGTPLPKGCSNMLDKIRAEVKDLTYYWCEVSPKSVIDDVLQIIDKYRESENQ